MAALPGQRSSNRISKGRIEQVFVTHCLKAESVLRQAGYSVRAASTDDEKLLRVALDLPGLQVPLSTGATPLDVDQAPRRLALQKTEDGQALLTCTSYLPFDSSSPPRPHSYFSHTLQLDQLDPLEAIRSWGADGWVSTYDSGAPLRLPSLDQIPEQGLLNDDVLSQFLADQPQPVTQQLATTYLPERFLNDPERRRRLVAQALHGFLLATEEQGTRSRLTIQAEPGVVALLIYAIARLLPPSVTKGMTFSTYEAAHATLRSATNTICGTYQSNLQRGLESSYLERLGFGIDTSLNVVSTALRDRRCNELVQLAVQQDWATIALVHDHWQRANLPLKIQIGELPFLQIDYSRATRDQLDPQHARSATWSALKEDPVIIERIWPRLFQLRHQPDLVQLYQEVYDREPHLATIRSACVKEIRKGSTSQWSLEWTLLKSIVPNDRRRLLEQLMSVLAEVDPQSTGNNPPAFEIRLGLLHELNGLKPHDDTLVQRHQWLLTVQDGDELNQLVSTSLPENWIVWGLISAVDAAGIDPIDVINELPSGSDRQRIFCDQLTYAPNRLEAIDRLLGVDDQKSYGLLIDLLDNSVEFDGEQLERLLTNHLIADPERVADWINETRFNRLAAALTPGSELIRRLWNQLAGLMNENALVGGRREQRPFRIASSAIEQLGAEVLPSSVREIVQSWVLLFRHLDQPGLGSQQGWNHHESLSRACDVCEIGSRSDLLVRVLKSRLGESPSGALSSRERDRFHATVAGFSAQGDLVNIFRRLIKTVNNEGIPTATRIDLLVSFLEQELPSGTERLDLARSYEKHLPPEVVQQIEQAVRQERKQAAAEASVVTLRERSSTSQQYQYSSDHHSSLLRLILFTAAGLILGVIVGGVVISIPVRNDLRKTEQSLRVQTTREEEVAQLAQNLQGAVRESQENPRQPSIDIGMLNEAIEPYRQEHDRASESTGMLVAFVDALVAQDRTRQQNMATGSSKVEDLESMLSRLRELITKEAERDELDVPGNLTLHEILTRLFQHRVERIDALQISKEDDATLESWRKDVITRLPIGEVTFQRSYNLPSPACDLIIVDDKNAEPSDPVLWIAYENGSVQRHQLPPGFSSDLPKGTPIPLPKASGSSKPAKLQRVVAGTSVTNGTVMPGFALASLSVTNDQNARNQSVSTEIWHEKVDQNGKFILSKQGTLNGSLTQLVSSENGIVVAVVDHSNRRPGSGSSLGLGGDLSKNDSINGWVLEEYRPGRDERGSWKTNCVAITPDGAWLAIGYRKKLVKIRPLSRPAENLPEMELSKIKGRQIQGVGFVGDSKANRMLLVASDTSIQLHGIDWETFTVAEEHSFQASLGDIEQLTVDPTGQFFAVGRKKGLVELWGFHREEQPGDTRSIPAPVYLLSLKADGEVQRMQFDLSGKYLMVGVSGNDPPKQKMISKITVWELR